MKRLDVSQLSKMPTGKKLAFTYTFFKKGVQPICFLKLQTIIPHRNQCALPQAWVRTELSVWAWGGAGPAPEEESEEAICSAVPPPGGLP